MPAFSVEAAVLPVRFAPIKYSTPPQDTVPFEGRSPSLVSYEEEEEVSEACLLSHPKKEQEVPPSVSQRSAEVPSSPFSHISEAV
ncbi:hypothetical protein P9112_001525 [Eukaryota sp. TZLM1-RC]